MRIGVITIHSAHNYGAMLQAYATQEILHKLGHDVEIIHFHPDYVENKNRRYRRGRSPKQYAIQAVEKIFSAKFKRRYEMFERFIKQRMVLTTRYASSEALLEAPPDFDTYICGSDQIWNMDAGGSKVHFLQFVPEGKRKISFSSSFGRNQIPEKYKDRLKELLSGFHAVSVRESSAIDIVLDACDFVPTQVLDPVFLLTKEDWSAIAIEPSLKGGYIAFYSLEVSPKLSDLVELVSKMLRLPVVILGKGGRFVLKCKTKMAIDSGPAEFLGWIQNATFVITNSFHSTAFAIIFQKPFFTVPHSTRNARMESLLLLTGLQSRQICDVEEVAEMSCEQMLSMEYEVAGKCLNRERTKSLSFLETSLIKR